MKLGWNINGCNHNDRFCHWRIYCFWHGYGGCGNTFILDKKMTTFTTEDRKMGADPLIIADQLEFEIDHVSLNSPHDAVTLVQAAYLLRMQHDEINALRKQLIAACNELMEVKR
jgi:hypothetical protein